jgi:hypothetical protein
MAVDADKNGCDDGSVKCFREHGAGSMVTSSWKGILAKQSSQMVDQWWRSSFVADSA